MALNARRRRGAASAESVVLVVAVALLGAAALPALGHGLGDAVASDGAAGSAQAAGTVAVASEAGTASALEPALEFVSHLPKEGSLAWDSYVHRVRRAFDPAAGKGFVVLPTEHLFPEAAGRALFKYYEDGTFDSNARGALLPPHKIVVSAFGDWARRLVGRALVRDVAPLTAADLRVRHNGAPILQNWHWDTGDVVASVSLLGPGAEYVNLSRSLADRVRSATANQVAAAYGDRYRTALRGELIIFGGKPGGPQTSQERFQGVHHGLLSPRVPRFVHRSPVTAQDRALMLTRMTVAPPPPMR